jgi:hypothetical protein
MKQQKVDNIIIPFAKRQTRDAQARKTHVPASGHVKEPSSLRKLQNCWPNSISFFLR